MSAGDIKPLKFRIIRDQNSSVLVSFTLSLLKINLWRIFKRFFQLYTLQEWQREKRVAIKKIQGSGSRVAFFILVLKLGLLSPGSHSSLLIITDNSPTAYKNFCLRFRPPSPGVPVLIPRAGLGRGEEWNELRILREGDRGGDGEIGMERYAVFPSAFIVALHGKASQPRSWFTAPGGG